MFFEYYGIFLQPTMDFQVKFERLRNSRPSFSITDRLPVLIPLEIRDEALDQSRFNALKKASTSHILIETSILPNNSLFISMSEGAYKGLNLQNSCKFWPSASNLILNSGNIELGKLDFSDECLISEIIYAKLIFSVEEERVISFSLEPLTKEKIRKGKPF